MTDRVTVALGQLRPRLGDVSANLEQHLAWIEQAKTNHAALIVFPELGLTGYQVQDLTLDVARTTKHPDIQRLVAASQDIDVVFSFVEESEQHLFYITAIYARRGQIAAKHRKVYLPTYGMFDEGRYFACGEEFRTVPTDFGRSGLMICEDAWHVSSPYLLALGGADLICVPASGPARSVAEQDRFGSHVFWRDLLQVYARLFGTYFIFVNRTGFEDGVNFFGGSGVISPEGEWLVEAPELTETLCYAELDLSVIRRARYITPILRDEKKHLVLRELERLLEHRERRDAE
ncbi:nitrilase-related carbon-nitrogen hydrolase [Alicyclobacillus ferrooxydans]|uniref:Acyltransferase n=1 Tax=Alicyclobacillus ferrooxydans TaxID=471514 RepID=A0A0P9EHT8_9BACL|nr:nitrilase-related carbon-nitrogen hydrolase [Alicyclobacillus ferrooxydans]KPV42263.1 acyltransferase [Alicyclobacillus ferrooxydans]